jgi:hypothetical protein
MFLYILFFIFGISGYLLLIKLYMINIDLGVANEILKVQNNALQYVIEKTNANKIKL